MALGRPIQPSDDTEGAPPVAVISYRMWQRRLNLDPQILGTSFTMNGVVVTVVGVTAPEYQGEIVQSDPPELWLALNQEEKFTGEKRRTPTIPIPTGSMLSGGSLRMRRWSRSRRN